MLKKSQTSSTPASDERALAIGISALEFLASDPELLARFLGLSGLEPVQLRAEARRPAFFAGLLDFMLDHEPTLERFCEHAGLDAAAVTSARTTLARSFGTTPPA